METFDMVIEKHDIARLGALKGRFVLGGPHDGKTFCGFAGRRFPDGRYHGVLRFDASVCKDAEPVTWDCVLGGEAEVAPSVIEEVPDGSE